MNDEQLQELRERVERRRRAAEVVDLKRELRGLNNEVDNAMIYLSVKEASEVLGVCESSIAYAIRDGWCPRAIRARHNWALHPSDVDGLRTRFARLIRSNRKRSS